VSTSAPELSPSASRTEAQYVRLVHVWRRHGDKGSRFASALESFLQHFPSPNTRRAYSFAVFEFFDWLELTERREILPDRIERKTAVDYASYLGSRDEGLDEERLQRDGRMAMELVIYRTVKRRSHISYKDLRLVLEADLASEVARRDRESALWLPRLLGCMVRQKLLERSPTIEEIRTKYRAETPPEFTFLVKRHTDARGVERASTIFQRIAILGSLWTWWIKRSAENVGTRPLLEHNIWEPVLEQYAAPARAASQASRELKTPSLDTFKRIVATTYTHKPTSYEAIRDRALLLFLFYTAVRPEEVSSLQRSSITGEPPLVTVVGKRRKMRQFLLPPETLGPLRELSQKLVDMAEHEEKVRPGQESRARRLLDDAAPLFPVGRPYGCNVSGDDFLSRDGIAMMMRRRGKLAGLEGTDAWVTLHPHGIRHLAARIAVASGTPLSRVQAILGHEHLSTTGVYVEERDPRALRLFTRGQGPRPALPAPAAPAPAGGGIVVRELGEATVAPPDEPRPRRRIVATAEPLAARPERLVEIGGPPSREALGGVREVFIGPPATLDEAYLAPHWGEEKRRSPLHRQKQPIPGFDLDEDRLTYTYMGKQTHLVWWEGSAGYLKPAMPVMSFRQSMEDAARFGPPIQQGLTDLWLAWFSSREPKRGPTAAAALVQWVREALVTMDQVEADRLASRRSWVPFDAELAPDALTLREHREDKILAWFGARAWSWTISERSKVKDTLDVPAWYADEDPTAAIPEAEREELFDWIAAVTGRQPTGKTAVFPRSPSGTLELTRKDLAALVGFFCVFNESADELGDMGQKLRPDPAGGVKMPSELKLTNDAIRKLVDKLTAGRVKTFDYALKTLGRMQRTRVKEAEGKEGQRETKRLFMLELLGELFGPKAKDDDVLSIYASCQTEPLQHTTGAPGGWKDFFRTEGGTLRHTGDFQKEFAKATGMHSECVARRIVRALHELKQEKSRLVKEDRRSELENQLASWMAFRVPCPAALEDELRSRMGPQDKPLAKSFSRALDARVLSDDELRELIEGREQAETYALPAKPRRDVRFEPNVARVTRHCPSPVTLLFWAHMRTRKRKVSKLWRY
jgi:integrase